MGDQSLKLRSAETQYQAVPLEEPGETDNAQANDDAPPDNEMSELRKCIGEIFVKGDKFHSLMAIVILGNAIVIGLETDLKSLAWLWDIVEDSFLFVFVIELGIRIYYWRWRLFTCNDAFSNVFDLVLVVVGVVDFIVTKVFQSNLGNASFYIKACRLLRILRLFRLFKMIKPLYMLASGFLDSSVAVFWVTVLCGLGLYICAIFLTRTLGQMPHVDEVYAVRFGSVSHSMFTLFELMANPDLKSVEEVMLASPGMMIFFVIFIIYGSFAMLSILTGVISEGMIEKGNSHKEEMRFVEEQKKNNFMAKLKMHFEASDVDGDGTMTREEFTNKLPEMMHMFHDEGFFYAQEDLMMVFELVDVDKGGTVEVDEFLQGMTSFTANVADLPLQMLRLQSNVFIHLNKLQDTFLSKFAALEEAQRNMDAKLNVLTLKAGGGQKHGFCF